MSRYLTCYAVLCMILCRKSSCKENVVDLSHDVDENSAVWITREPYEIVKSTKGYAAGGYWYETYRFCMSEHTGTHLDAPSHFAEGKWSVEQIPLDHLMGPGVVIDIRDKVVKDPNAELTTDDVMSWLDEHGPLPNGVIVFVRTGWASRYSNKTAYFGTDKNDTTKLVFPGISKGAAQLLVSHEAVSGNKVVGVGLDTPSLDYGKSQDFETHQTLMRANVYGLENVANLDRLPTKGFNVIVMPIKLRGGSGGPARILATMPSSGGASLSSAFVGSSFVIALNMLCLCHMF
ncbi:isatin hydrolase-like [Macrobrachium nipponense]|uniref:isatin hydrolase-like n=1 Tax=Macrobrachium nipponense TaxID=159736 RepID=UPI0030C83134